MRNVLEKITHSFLFCVYFPISMCQDKHTNPEAELKKHLAIMAKSFEQNQILENI